MWEEDAAACVCIKANRCRTVSRISRPDLGLFERALREQREFGRFFMVALLLLSGASAFAPASNLLHLRAPSHGIAVPTRRASSAICRAYTTLDADEVAARTQRVLAIKEQSGRSFDEIAVELGLTNTYTAQLFLGQAQLKPATATKLKELMPGISDADIEAMQGCPMRGFDDAILKEPNVYRTYEAITVRHANNASNTPCK